MLRGSGTPAGGFDVLVVGGGPAGRALAGACARTGLRTALLDPAPERRWWAVYGCWADELPADLPATAVATRSRGRAVAVREHRLGRDYVMLDVPGLRAHLDAGMHEVTVLTGHATGSAGPGRVAVAGRPDVVASVVVDAAGRGRPWHPRPPGRVPAEQTAFGVVVDAATAAPLVAPGEALFMDWRPDHGEAGWPTFLYGMPLGGDAVLLEETSLARRPGLPLPVLRRRLHARLARHGIAVPAGAATDKVSFPVDDLRHRAPDAVGFGAAAPLVHPATGFSIAAALRLAPAVAAALREHLPGRPDAALRAAEATVWPATARAVHGFRHIGLEALLRMPPDRVPGFFDVFFDLPDRERWCYLTGRDDLRGTVVTMTRLFAAAGWDLRRWLVTPALLPRLPANRDEVEPVAPAVGQRR